MFLHKNVFRRPPCVRRRLRSIANAAGSGSRNRAGQGRHEFRLKCGFYFQKRVPHIFGSAPENRILSPENGTEVLPAAAPVYTVYTFLIIARFHPEVKLFLHRFLIFLTEITPGKENHDKTHTTTGVTSSQGAAFTIYVSNILKHRKEVQRFRTVDEGKHTFTVIDSDPNADRQNGAVEDLSG